MTCIEKFYNEMSEALLTYDLCVGACGSPECKQNCADAMRAAVEAALANYKACVSEGGSGA